MSNRKLAGTTHSGWNVACSAFLFLATILISSPARAQTALMPPGAGTAGNPYRISGIDHLVWMSDHVNSSAGTYYTVQSNINASATSGWNGGAGFVPIGTNDLNAFGGIFNGNGKVISNLTINWPLKTYVGLFGCVGNNGLVKNLGLAGCTIGGNYYVGALAGYNYGIVSNCFSAGTVGAFSHCGGLVGVNCSAVADCSATGTVGGVTTIGGLVGLSNSGRETGCQASGSVTGSGDHIGGLVGYQSLGLVSNCFSASGTVCGSNNVGGLVGENGGGTVVDCNAACSVVGSNNVGGLVGESQAGTLRACYATGPVAGYYFVGGLVGDNNGNSVSNCYATGGVKGSGFCIGGLMGRNWGIQSRCFAAGKVEDGFNMGGLNGHNDGTVTNSYWDTNATGQTISDCGGTGKTTAEMKRRATFAGWDFTNDWRIAEGLSYPMLRLHLNWNTTPGADWYYLWINRNGTTWLKKWLHQSSGTWSPDNDLPSGAYTWWVQPWNNATGPGAWSSVARFSIRDTALPAAVALITPSIAAPTGTVVYTWEADRYATHYELRINRNGSKWVGKWYNTGATTGTVARALPAHTAGPAYQWWVRGWWADGYGPWSASRTFTCGKCVPTVPVDGGLVQHWPPELRWAGLPNTTDHEVWMNKDGAKFLDLRTGSASPDWTPTLHGDLGSYTWWVRDISGTRTGTWSSASHFTFDIL